MTRLQPLLSLGLALGLLTGLAAPARAQNEIWVGELTALSVNEAPEGDKGKLAINAQLSEDQTDGKFGSFEFEKTIVWSPLDGGAAGARIQLDGVSPGDFKTYDARFGHALVTRIRAEVSADSVQKPDLRQTKSGRQLEHAVLVIEARRPILVNTRLIKDQGGEFVTLQFEVIERPGSAGPQRLTNSLEFSTEDFDRPPTKPLVSRFSARQQQFIERSLEALEAADPEDYVTAVYPAQFADANTLNGLVRGRLSQLGRIDVDRDRSTLVVTDRARFVQPVIETLLNLDRRPPQVTIVAQIIEINRSAGQQLGVDFSYLGNRSRSGLNGAGFSNSGILDSGPILSGVYQKFSSNALQQFAADINALVEHRKAKITAQPVLRVLNNARGIFNAGENLPFFIVNSESDVSNRRDFSSEDDFRRGVGEGIANTSVLREQRSDRDVTAFSEGRQNRGVQQVRTGTRLTVSPQLRNSDECLLSINASYNEVTGFAQPHGNPIIAERSVDTRVRVRHGETIVLAGLYRQVEKTQTAGLPLLSDLPVLGKLFRSERSSKETFDIVFILTTFIQHD